MKSIQIFKPGKHTAMSGSTLAFSESDLQATAAAYDPAKHEAPIVIGHPQADAPAYGWVKDLKFADGLCASPDQVDPQFAEMVRAGKFKKVSASFYTPDSPSNPVPGVYYLRHVGFLGAQPPAVKGLRSPEFADAEKGIVEFGDWTDVQNASLWRRLREWMIGEKGLDVADNILPDYAVQSLEQNALQSDPDDEADSPAPQFSETKGAGMTDEEKVRLAALEAENAKLKKQAGEQQKAEIHAANAAFAEKLVQEGKLLPVQKSVCVATLDFAESCETVVEFGEGDEKKPLKDAIRGFLESLPNQVEYGELSRDKGAERTVEFAGAPGYTIDPAKLDIHAKALAYQEHHKVDYVTAVKAVGGN